jgi:hypothetical protein
MSIINLAGRDFDDPVALAALGQDEPTEINVVNEADLVDKDEPAYADIIRAAIQAETLGFDMADPAIADTVIRGARRNHADRVRDEYIRGERNEARRQREQHPPVVYYMRVGNRVKIGFSTNLTSRISDVMPEEVLATEPGGPDVERARHRQFADLRVAREWFRYEGPLVEHVARLAERAA